MTLPRGTPALGVKVGHAQADALVAFESTGRSQHLDGWGPHGEVRWAF